MKIFFWVDTAVMRRVKSLDLMFSPRVKDVVFELPNCLVTSDSLEVLRLGLFGRPMVLPDAVTFPALRVLELNNVCFYEHALVETLLRSCPLLEDSSLIGCSIRKHGCVLISSTKLKTLRFRNLHNFIYARVSCPKLVCLEYAGHGYRFFIENVVSLKKAVILFEDGAQKEISYDLGNIACKLFSGITHVESLSLNFHFIQCIEAARYSNRHFPTPLPNLKTLELTITIDAFTMNVLLQILRCSPNLESLHLIIRKELLTLESWELDEVEGRSILTRHLKRVKFLEFDGEKQKLDISRVLLEHGNALEEMVFSWCSDAKYHEKSTETMDEVSKFYKASSTVKVISFLKG